MTNVKFVFALGLLLLALSPAAIAQTAASSNVNIANVRMRDACVLADEKTKTYYLLSSTMANTVEGGRRPALRVYTSKDLRNWEGPHIVFQTPEKFWGDINIKFDAAKFGSIGGIFIGIAAVFLTFGLHLDPTNPGDLLIIVPIMAVAIFISLLVYFQPWRKKFN